MAIIKYVGSKSRIAKHIVPIIQSYIDSTSAAFYLEPFIGGANVIDKISCDRKIGYDINHYLIELFKHRDQITSLPDEITQEEYAAVRKSYQMQDGKYPDWYIGAVGFLASYNGKFFGGRAGIVKTKIDTYRNYYDEAKRNVIAQLPNLQDVEFAEADYRTLDLDCFRGGVISVTFLIRERLDTKMISIMMNSGNGQSKRLKRILFWYQNNKHQRIGDQFGRSQ